MYLLARIAAMFRVLNTAVYEWVCVAASAIASYSHLHMHVNVSQIVMAGTHVLGHVTLIA